METEENEEENKMLEMYKRKIYGSRESKDASLLDYTLSFIYRCILYRGLITKLFWNIINNKIELNIHILNR